MNYIKGCTTKKKCNFTVLIFHQRFCFLFQTPSSLIVFDGLQKVRVRRNLLSDNSLAYALVAGMRTARLESTLDATENWWGTTDPLLIQHFIFDFDDWNDHALVNFAPFLVEDNFQGSLSVSGGMIGDYLKFLCLFFPTFIYEKNPIGWVCHNMYVKV